MFIDSKYLLPNSKHNCFLYPGFHDKPYKTHNRNTVLLYAYHELAGIANDMLKKYSSAKYMYFCGKGFGTYNSISYSIMQYNYAEETNELKFLIELPNELISILQKHDLSLSIEYKESENNEYRYFSLDLILLS